MQVSQLTKVDATLDLAQSYRISVDSWYSKNSKNSLVEHIQSVAKAKIQELLNEVEKIKASLQVVEAAKDGPGLLPDVLIGTIASYFDSTEVPSLLPHLANALGTTVSFRMKEEAYKGKDNERLREAIQQFLTAMEDEKKTDMEIQLEGPLPGVISFEMFASYDNPQVWQFLIRHCPCIQTLTFNHDWKLENVLTFLPRFPQLRHIKIMGYQTGSQLLKPDFSVFAQLPQLESLDLQGVLVTPEAFSFITGLRNLKRLRLSDASLSGTQNKSALWSQLTSWNQLNTLDINLINFMSVRQSENSCYPIYNSLSSCTQLSRLRIRSFNCISSLASELSAAEFYQKIKQLPQLTTLDIDMRFHALLSSQNVNEFIQAVVAMPQLKTIRFYGRTALNGSQSDTQVVLAKVELELKELRPDLNLKFHIRPFYASDSWEESFYNYIPQ